MLVVVDMADDYLHSIGNDAEGLILEAARTHFNSAASLEDPVLRVARKW